MPSNTSPKQILLAGNPIAYEAVGLGTITPGMLLDMNSNGKVIPHATAAAVASRYVAREEEYQGTGYDTDYATGDRVPYYVARSGERFWMLLADSMTIAKGDLLESNGDGFLRKSTHAVTSATTAAAWPLFRALEAVTTSGATARIQVEAI